MPSFPDGTRVWIDVNGEPLTEYEKEVEKWTQNNGRGEEEQQHRVTVRQSSIRRDSTSTILLTAASPLNTYRYRCQEEPSVRQGHPSCQEGSRQE